MKVKMMLGYSIIETTKAKMKTDYEKLFVQLKKNFKNGQAIVVKA